MKIKNFATFGLFVDGDMIDSGSIHAMENEATRRILSGQAEAAHISVFDFDGDKVVEKTPVLSLRRSNNDIIIANMLLPDTVRCNIGSGILWLCDLEKLQRHFDIKGVIAEGDNIALLIRNYQL